MDWTATMLALGGAAAAAGFPLDGDDLTPLLRNPSLRSERALFWRTQAREAARLGDWKYVKDGQSGALFNLAVDPGEKTDLRQRRPAEFDRVTAAFATWNDTMRPRR